MLVNLRADAAALGHLAADRVLVFRRQHAFGQWEQVGILNLDVRLVKGCQFFGDRKETGGRGGSQRSVAQPGGAEIRGLGMQPVRAKMIGFKGVHLGQGSLRFLAGQGAQAWEERLLLVGSVLGGGVLKVLERRGEGVPVIGGQLAPTELGGHFHQHTQEALDTSVAIG